MGDAMKHKHAEIIKAWADGAHIQVKVFNHGDWKDVDMNGEEWYEHSTYRIKPEPDVVKIFYLESNPMLGLRFSEEINPVQEKTKRIVCTFDGETNILKAVEML